MLCSTLDSKDTKVTHPIYIITLDADDNSTHYEDHLMYRYGSGGTVEIFDIVVRSQRGVGKGTKMIQQLVSSMKGKTHLIWALVRISNAIGKHFYERNGFQLIAILPRFYAEESAIMMGRAP